MVAIVFLCKLSVLSMSWTPLACKSGSHFTTTVLVIGEFLVLLDSLITTLVIGESNVASGSLFISTIVACVVVKGVFEKEATGIGFIW